MKRKIITTSDGSKTIQIEDWNEQYHSIHGAIQEANHVFIKHGLLFYFQSCHPELVSGPNSICILEIGFGTGLNAFLTYLKVEELQQPINYVGVEAYPVKSEEIAQLNYVELISENHFSEIICPRINFRAPNRKIIHSISLKSLDSFYFSNHDFKSF